MQEMFKFSESQSPSFVGVGKWYIHGACELKDLTPVEESLIFLCRAKCWVLHLKESKDHSGAGSVLGVQRGLRGNIVIHRFSADAVNGRRERIALGLGNILGFGGQALWKLPLLSDRSALRPPYPYFPKLHVPCLNFLALTCPRSAVPCHLYRYHFP